MLIEGVNSGMSDANALKEELAEVLGGLRRYKRDVYKRQTIGLVSSFFVAGMVYSYGATYFILEFLLCFINTDS